jgi:hypothetical protein
MILFSLFRFLVPRVELFLFMNNSVHNLSVTNYALVGRLMGSAPIMGSHHIVSDSLSGRTFDSSSA